MNTPFLSRSSFGNPVDLYEAYQRVKKYRDALQELMNVDMVLMPYQKTRLTQEFNAVNRWMIEKEKIITVQFVIS